MLIPSTRASALPTLMGTLPYDLRLPTRNARDVMTHRVLVIEDDPDIAHLVQLHLRDLPCVVDVVQDGPSALDAALARSYDAIVLDIMLPRLDGLAVCQALRQQRIYTPILMLTARSTELDRVVGLELGADDYLTKPFSVPELMARVKAFFRRADAYSPRDAVAHATVLKLDELLSPRPEAETPSSRDGTET